MFFLCLCLLIPTIFASNENRSDLQKLFKVKKNYEETKENDQKNIVWRDWEQLEKAGKWHKNLIKDWYNRAHKQDDAIANLLQTMIMFDKNGKPHMPNGIHPSEKESAKAESEDKHVYPKADKKRNFAEKVQLWEYGYIPYSINPQFNSTQTKIVQLGMNEFTLKTCIRFVQKDYAAWSYLPHNTYLYFTYGKSCSSYVGRIRSSPQNIELNPTSCFTKRTIVHEIMHALGQVHEQQRKDRDNYITMQWNNIADGRQNQNMEKLAIGSKDRTHYDPSSVLQYGLWAFSTNRGKTMSFHDRKLESLVGSSTGLTHLDVKEITLAYNCAAGCTNKPYCRNGGFVGNGCRCVCPDGLTGSECQDVESDSDCGGVATLGSVGYTDLKSPNFPNRYPVDKKCTAIITAPEGTKIKLEVVESRLNLKKDLQRNACLHWLEVRYVSPEIIGPKFCTPFSPIETEGNTLMIRFDSRFSKDYYPDSNQMFHLRASTGGATAPTGQTGVPPPPPTSFDKICSFDTSESCWMSMSGLHIVQYASRWGMTPSYGARSTPGYAYINSQTSFSIQTPANALDGEYCLSFGFYMQGTSVSIGLHYSGYGSVWHRSNPPGNFWSIVSISLRANQGTVLTIYGQLVSNGVIAVDEIRIRSNSCT
uniref:Metalloendopeptidase n=1 Tax=Crassostrea virginica TaxID=6565 RepID=A0A8B8EV16_CRAVI|nr:blastula protease 10-like [Crassostrea virginica]